MAHLFPDCVGEVDVVANAENIKRLLKLPYSSNTISMMVHRIGNTLLIDDFDVHRFLLKQEDCNWQWLRKFIYENIFSRLNDPERSSFSKQATRSDATQQKSLLSKFLYHSLSRTEENNQEVTSTSNSTDLDVDLIQTSNQLTCNDPLLPEPNIEENVPDPKHTKHTYNRNVIWMFEDIRMLVGTDMAIFGGSSRPCISLRLRDMHQPINVLTGIDYWLDNLMCNVPEVVMCYHLDGLVQKYEIIKTEDLPYLEGSRFSPNVIRNVAQNILSFLKQNATKSGHTYWLFKGRNDDVVKLYDLTSLCTNSEFESQTAQAEKQKSESNKKCDENPFTVPVAMLLYKVARNMKTSSENISAKQAGSIKALLDNCIKLLPKEKYPQIVTSSYYLLSDLHIPIGIDPISPKFDNDSSESDSQSIDDDEHNNSDDNSSMNGDEQSNEKNIAIQSVNDATKESSHNKCWDKHNSTPQPLTGSIDERCANALQYIANGLNCLQYVSLTEEKLIKEREEIAKQAEKMRIIQEEQNPNMAKPYQAIPLPYEPLTPRKSTDSVKDIKLDNTKTSKRAKKKNQFMSESEAVQSLQRTCPSNVIKSWNVHLKLLLLEKACLIYAIQTEREYQQERYGTALRFIMLAMKCHRIVNTHMLSISSSKSNYQTNIIARAGDCFFQCAQHFNDINKFLAQYEIERDVDIAIHKELQKEIETDRDDFKIPELTDNMEQLILASTACYEMALQQTDGSDTNTKNELIGRAGSVLNELGVLYMHWSQEIHQKLLEDENLTNDSEKEEDSVVKPEPLYMTLAKKSYDCLIRGIALFEEIKDDANLAILLGNMGRFMRFRAHLQEGKEFSFQKICYENAFTSYQRALAILESRKHDSHIWVTWELSTSKFTLAKLMLEYFQDNMVRIFEILCFYIFPNYLITIIFSIQIRRKKSKKRSLNCYWVH